MTTVFELRESGIPSLRIRVPESWEGFRVDDRYLLPDIEQTGAQVAGGYVGPSREDGLTPTLTFLVVDPPFPAWVEQPVDTSGQIVQDVDGGATLRRLVAHVAHRLGTGYVAIHLFVELDGVAVIVVAMCGIDSFDEDWPVLMQMLTPLRDLEAGVFERWFP